MGLLDIFSKKPTPAKIGKAQKRMLNEHHQKEVRQEAMQELADFDSPESLRALTQRLAVNFRDTITNEKEKRWVTDTLIERFGERSVAPLIDVITTEQNVSGAIRTLKRLVPEQRLLDLLLETLRALAPLDHRTIQARLQLVDALADHDDPRIVPTLLPYLRDHDDDVRIKVVDTLEGKAHAEHPSRPDVELALLELLRDPEIGSRIRRRTADAIGHLNVDVSTRRDEVTENLPDGYAITEQGRIVRQ